MSGMLQTSKFDKRLSVKLWCEKYVMEMTENPILLDLRPKRTYVEINKKNETVDDRRAKERES